MPSRKRSPTKKNGTCKHCGHRMKGGWELPSWLGGPAKPSTTVPNNAQPVPVTPPQNAQPVPDTPPDNVNGERIPKQNETHAPGTHGGKEKTTLFGTWGGKSKKSKKSKNSKSKKSKKSKK